MILKFKNLTIEVVSLPTKPDFFINFQFFEIRIAKVIMIVLVFEL